MSELRVRIRTLFYRIDQEISEYAAAHGIERAHGVQYAPSVDRFWRGRTVQ